MFSLEIRSKCNGQEQQLNRPGFSGKHLDDVALADDVMAELGFVSQAAMAWLG